MPDKQSSRLDLLLKKWALVTTSPQLRQPVGAVPAEDYLNEVGYKKVGWRAFRRSLIFMATRQAKSKISSLKTGGKRGLWLYFGEGQIGDALMDLAPRSLLQQQGFRMDLLTDKALAHLFHGDPWFETVTSDVSLLTEVPYDFAIVLSNKRRSIQHKRRYFKKLPWVSILESFSGPDFNRAGYATQRLSDLLELELSPVEFSFHTRQKLGPRISSDEFQSQTTQARNAIALCVGGVDPRRTFSGWEPVVRALIQRGKTAFLLVGSSNGASDAHRIKQTFGNLTFIHDYVGKCSIAQSHDLLAAARVVVCADGGLMHLAATTATPIAALFSSAIRPEWRLPSRPNALFSCSATEDVNDIPPDEIVEKICSLWSNA